MAVEQIYTEEGLIGRSVPERWTKICEFCKDSLKIPVIKSRRATTPQMTSTFAAVDLSNIQAWAKDLKEYVETENDLLERFKGRCLMSFRVQTYGQNALQLLFNLRLLLTGNKFSLFGQLNGFGIGEVGEVNNISAVLLDSDYEERAELEFSVFTAIPYQVYIDWYNRFKLSIEVDGRLFSEQEVNLENF